MYKFSFWTKKRNECYEEYFGNLAKNKYNVPRRARVLGLRPKQHRGVTTPRWRKKDRKNEYPFFENNKVVLVPKA